MTAASGLSVALELFDVAVRLRAERFRREHPGASEVEVEACVQAWLLDRPGAPDGDAPGHRRTSPRPA